jgi:hypothetical protein
MQRLILLFTTALLWTAGSVPAQEVDLSETRIAADPRVSLPWSEFKQLYAERLQREWSEAMAEQKPFLYTIDNAAYRLQLSAAGARGNLRLTGQLLQGQPRPLTLFSTDLTITQVNTIEGGSLLSDAQGYHLYLDQSGAFQLDCEILLPLREDPRSPFVTFTIPAAVQNSLSLELDPNWRVLDAPGRQLDDGPYFFAPQQQVLVRFAPVDGDLGQPPLVDSFTRIELLDDGYRATVYLAPRREPSQPLRVRFPQARWLNASVQRSWISTAGDDMVITLPPDWHQPLTLDYELPVDAATLQLPTIADNLGQEGAFQVIVPTSARINLSGDGLQLGLDNQRLPSDLLQYAGISGSYTRIPPTHAVQLALERFDTVAEPAVVLNAVYQYTSVADNGTLLSILHLQVPPLPQRRLILAAVADAEVWSLTVNGKPQSVYGQRDSRWIVPLAEGDSLVELAYWRKTSRLTLQGRLELLTPALGLAAQSYYLALGLPERVDLVALEGDLEPGDGKNWPRVRPFSGRPYYFTQPFYRGETLPIAIHYREPVATSGRDAS